MNSEIDEILKRHEERLRKIEESLFGLKEKNKD